MSIKLPDERRNFFRVGTGNLRPKARPRSGMSQVNRPPVSATRSSVPGTFSAPTNVAELNTASVDASPAISPDNLTIFFTSTRSGGLGSSDIWYAIRADTNAPFGTAWNLTPVNSTSADYDPSLSPDGRTIFFASYRAGGSGSTDIWYATRSCE